MMVLYNVGRVFAFRQFFVQEILVGSFYGCFLAALCLLAVLPQQTIKGFLLAYGQFARLDARVVDTEERVDIVHGLSANVSEFLDLGCRVLDLETAR